MLLLNNDDLVSSLLRMEYSCIIPDHLSVFLAEIVLLVHVGVITIGTGNE